MTFHSVTSSLETVKVLLFLYRNRDNKNKNKITFLIFNNNLPHFEKNFFKSLQDKRRNRFEKFFEFRNR